MGEEGHGQLTLPRSRTKKRARFDPLLAGSFNELTRYLIFLERRARSPLLSACPARYRIPTTNAAVITVASSRLRLRVCVAYVMRMQRTLYHFFFSAIFENSDSRRSFCPLELCIFICRGGENETFKIPATFQFACVIIELRKREKFIHFSLSPAHIQKNKFWRHDFY